jgi:hypothetical protein
MSITAASITAQATASRDAQDPSSVGPNVVESASFRMGVHDRTDALSVLASRLIVVPYLGGESIRFEPTPLAHEMPAMSPSTQPVAAAAAEPVASLYREHWNLDGAADPSEQATLHASFDPYALETSLYRQWRAPGFAKKCSSRGTFLAHLHADRVAYFEITQDANIGGVYSRCFYRLKGEATIHQEVPLVAPGIGWKMAAGCRGATL